MFRLFLPFFLPILLVCQTVGQDLPGQEAPAAKQQETVDFAKDIQPLFAAKCYSCHGDEKHESGLRINSRDAALRGGDNGRLLTASNSEESMLAQVLNGTHESVERMPADDEPLSAEQISLVRKWIDQGAEWPDDMAHVPSIHWAFVSPTRPTPPSVKHRGYVRNSIDQFVLAKLEAAGTKPAEAASKETLLRRLSLD